MNKLTEHELNRIFTLITRLLVEKKFSIVSALNCMGVAIGVKLPLEIGLTSYPFAQFDDCIEWTFSINVERANEYFNGVPNEKEKIK